MRRAFRVMGRWLAGLCGAALLLNLVSFLYYRPAGWIERTDSATNAIWNPGKTILQATEGMGVYKVDRNGYLNPDVPLGGGYTLVVGASFVAGLQVRAGERYVDILNQKLAPSDETLAAYCCSQDSFLLPDIIEGFHAITQEFPDAKNIVLDVGTSDFSVEEIQAAMNQHGFDEAQMGRNIVPTLPFKKRIIMKVKETFPLLSIVKKQVKDSLEKPNEEELSIDIPSYMGAMNEALGLLRSEFDGNLIVMYHPPVRIERDGTMYIVQSKTYRAFAQCCRQNGIVFVDMSEPFARAYREKHVVPYGFVNTSVASGHISASGHRVIAEELYRVIQNCESNVGSH